MRDLKRRLSAAEADLVAVASGSYPTETAELVKKIVKLSQQNQVETQRLSECHEELAATQSRLMAALEENKRYEREAAELTAQRARREAEDVAAAKSAEDAAKSELLEVLIVRG